MPAMVMELCEPSTTRNLIVRSVSARSASRARGCAALMCRFRSRTGLQHEGTLPECKADEDWEYFRHHQFQEAFANVTFGFRPPPSCLLLLVRHGTALNNVDKVRGRGKEP
jgi:hypothetical protein